MRWSPVMLPIIYVGARVLLGVATAHAVSQVPTPPVETESELQTFMCSIISWFFWIVLVISVIMVLYSAFTYVTAGDNQEKTSKARKTLTYAAIGIAVAIIAAGVPAIVSSIFPNEPGVTLADTCSF